MWGRTTVSQESRNGLDWLCSGPKSVACRMTWVYHVNHFADVIQTSEPERKRQCNECKEATAISPCCRYPSAVIVMAMTIPGLISHRIFSFYLSTGPIDPTEGVEHAEAIARSIASASDKPSVVYSSPFQRTAETAHRIAMACGCSVRIEEGLTEWQVLSLLVDPSGTRTYPKTTPELAELFSSIDVSYASINPSDGSDGSPSFPESEEQLLARCTKTIRGILDQTSDNICIVSHAPCDQSIAFYLEGAASVSESSLGPWALGGVTKFTGNKLVMYSDTKHMPGIYQPGIKKWSLPCLDK